MRAFINVPQGKIVKVYNREFTRGEAEVSVFEKQILQAAGVVEQDVVVEDKKVKGKNK